MTTGPRSDMLTLKDVADRLKKQDEISVMEILELTSEDLVERFMDRVEERFEELQDDLCDDASMYDDNDEGYDEWN